MDVLRVKYSDSTGVLKNYVLDILYQGIRMVTHSRALEDELLA